MRGIVFGVACAAAAAEELGEMLAKAIMPLIDDSTRPSVEDDDPFGNDNSTHTTLVEQQTDHLLGSLAVS